MREIQYIQQPTEFLCGQACVAMIGGEAYILFAVSGHVWGPQCHLKWMIAYHAETDIAEHLRCDGIRRVHFRADGTPYFQMSAEEDLPEAAREVRIRVRVG